MNQSIIQGIGNSMRYWANFICSVKRQKIINEGSIKYGTSEYLVANESLEPGRSHVMATPKIEKVEFEKTHEIFERRRTDLFLQVSSESNITNAYFEFKYLRTPLQRSEINRYINDFLRLASLIKYDKQCECFFMLVGIQTEISNILSGSTSYVDASNADRSTENIKSGNTIDDSDVKKCLTLCNNEPKSLIIKDLTYTEKGLKKSHLERFKNEYKYRDTIKDELQIKDTDTIQFELKYPSEKYGNDKIGVYIWQIKT